MLDFALADAVATLDLEEGIDFGVVLDFDFDAVRSCPGAESIARIRTHEGLSLNRTCISCRTCKN